MLESTMIYAKVHDHTVAEDYYTAMARIEKRLDLFTNPEKEDEHISISEREQLLVLIEQLAKPELPQQDRLVMVAKVRRLLRQSN